MEGRATDQFMNDAVPNYMPRSEWRGHHATPHAHRLTRADVARGPIRSLRIKGTLCAGVRQVVSKERHHTAQQQQQHRHCNQARTHAVRDVVSGPGESGFV